MTTKKDLLAAFLVAALGVACSDGESVGKGEPAPNPNPEPENPEPVWFDADAAELDFALCARALPIVRTIQLNNRSQEHLYVKSVATSAPFSAELGFGGGSTPAGWAREVVVTYRPQGPGKVSVPLQIIFAKGPFQDDPILTASVTLTGDAFDRPAGVQLKVACEGEGVVRESCEQWSFYADGAGASRAVAMGAQLEMGIRLYNAGCEDATVESVRSELRNTNFWLNNPEGNSTRLPAFPPDRDPAPYGITWKATFAPRAEGEANETVKVQIRGAPPAQVALRGVGGTQAVSLDPTGAVTFCSQPGEPLGRHRETTKSFQVSNSSDLPMQIRNVFTHRDAYWVWLPGNTVPPQSSLSLNVVYRAFVADGLDDGPLRLSVGGVDLEAELIGLPPPGDLIGRSLDQEPVDYDISNGQVVFHNQTTRRLEITGAELVQNEPADAWRLAPRSYPIVLDQFDGSSLGIELVQDAQGHEDAMVRIHYRYPEFGCESWVDVRVFNY